MSITKQAQYKENSRAELLQLIERKPEKVLEIGCREGSFLVKLKQFFGDDVECWGIDSDKRVEKTAKENLDKFISAEYYGDNVKDLEGHKFDLIVFNDVLEHLFDPWTALQSSSKYLTDDGVILGSLPNVRHWSVVKNLLFHDLFKYSKTSILDITHVRFFTTKTMLLLFKESGSRLWPFC